MPTHQQLTQSVLHIRLAFLMKKPTLHIEQQQPRHLQRSDIAPTEGYALVVDGHFKTQFAEEGPAKKAAIELLAKYPMLQVEIYDASKKSRSSLAKVAQSTSQHS
jgi:hypothetical protein